MTLLSNSIYWVYGVNILLHALSALVALLVSIFGFKAYRMTSEKKYLYLLFAFLMLAVSMVLKAVADVFVYQSLVFFYEPLENVTYLFIHLSSSILILSAYSLFISLYLKAKDLLYYILVLMSVALALLSYNGIIKFNLIAVMLLFFVCLQAYRNFTKKVNLNAFLVFFGFTLLICSHVLMMVSVYPPNLRYYSLGNIFQLLSFIGFGLMLSRVK